MLMMFGPVMMMMFITISAETLKLEGETENMGVCTKERKGITAAVLMANDDVKD